jgi:hypothetical protein
MCGWGGWRTGFICRFGHLQHRLPLVAQVDPGKPRILTPPAGKFLFQPLPSRREVLTAEVHQQVRSSRGQQDPHILRVGEIDLAQL